MGIDNKILLKIINKNNNNYGFFPMAAVNIVEGTDRAS